MARISVLSKQYVKAAVSGRENGVAINPTGSTVTMAFKAEGETPAGGDWKAASWETAVEAFGNVYWARCLVGPGGTITLAAGLQYVVWVKVDNISLESPVMASQEVLEAY